MAFKRLSAAQKAEFTRVDAKVHALRSAESELTLYHERLTRGLDRMPSTSAKDFVRSLVHTPRIEGYLPLSNASVRMAASEAMIDVLQDLFASYAPDIRLLTLTWDDGFTYEDRPTADVGGMILTARQVLESVELEGLCTVEVDALSRRIDGERCRRLIIHIHGACWTRGGEFDAPAKEQQIAHILRGRSKHHPWDAKPAVITSQPTNWYSVAHLAQYVTKPNAHVKKRVWRENVGRHKLLVAPKAEYSPALALRFADLLSRADVTKMVFGAGSDGAQLHERWKAEILNWATSRAGLSFDTTAAEAKEAWQAVYQSADRAPYDHFHMGNVRF